MAGQVLVFVIMTLLEREDLRDRVLRLAGPARPAPCNRGDGRRSASDQHELDEGVTTDALPAQALTIGRGQSVSEA
jgi:hypothetical protein